MTTNPLDFIAFPKIARLSREIVVTEKLDGTNAQIVIGENGEFLTASRSRFITPEQDNFGFSAWAHANKEELMKLGPGRHFGEWWGCGIQRCYGLKEKRFSLFNVRKWSDDAVRPKCCHVVPELARGFFGELSIDYIMDSMRIGGSVAAPGYMNPEGIIVFHSAASILFKKTFEKDDHGKEAA